MSEVAHRRRRSQARQRILAAARELLEQRPWSEISLEEIMRGAELTRTAFYRHFDDRQLLLLALVEELGSGFDGVAAPWTEVDAAADPARELGPALRALTEVYVGEGRLLQAIADGAAQDPDLHDTYMALGERITDGVARTIEREVAAGRSGVADPREVASALVWMNERYLLQHFGRTPDGDVERVAAALHVIWHSAIYGEAPGAAARG
ncbi:helix-turn-helix domain-containing protein [Conexibacter stalactiti]|uniref:Helix-turn-helix domain-containing protein n=1 Tax=Conexibacter stalactiti TaxID=1940611 RepID=A0ABU4HYI7_9ACTN|nr:helix-turn-helix domain-containing protein [Conexibacter stalactiti]MDW5598375.1 helix-turn-helix domain-containing protein [Conexibacter stalactiti]MEC5039017.1 helix-turn-helix domain-containing protein [Conexibacter stalactiti]